MSGGGSGHEPSFSSFVGKGLLSGAVAGTIFASPSAEQVRRCILHRVSREKGVLVVVMNYTVCFCELPLVTCWEWGVHGLEGAVLI